MSNPNDMENVGVSRIDEIDDANRSSGTSAVENIGKSAAKSALDKHNEKQKSKKKAEDDSVLKSDKKSKDKSDLLKNESDKNSDADSDDVAQDAKNVGKNAKRAVAAANAGMKGAIFIKFMNMMHMAMAMLGNFAGAIGSAAAGFLGFLGQVGAAIASGVSAVANGIVGFVTGAASFVSSALGIGATAATATVASVSIVGVLSLIFAVGGVVISTSNNAQRDGRLVDCRTEVTQAMTPVEDVNADAMQLKNAQQIYSVLSTYGLSDEQVAGVLGNFSTESGIDPTTIEGIYDEDHNINGPRHQDAMKDWDAYVRGDLSDMYAGFSGSGGPVKNPGGYTASDGKMYPGIGMGQYTGGGAMTFLNFAEQTNTPWYTVDFQLAYTLAKGAPTGSFGGSGGFWNEYKKQTGDAREMAFFFSKYWEGNTQNGFPERQDSAASWYEKLSSWDVDKAYANSVIAIAEQMGSVATDNNVASKKDTCVSTINADNSSIANAAVSYAYETQAEGKGNNGTELYQRVHDNIFPGDPWYMSCDRGVATAVRWSGSDDTFPAGATGTQLSYLQTSDKWKSVGMSGSLTMEDLLPGDVFCLDGHIFLYTGTEAVKAKYPNSNGDSVSASFEERSPGVGIDATDIVVNRNGQDWIGRGEYEVFRCVKSDNSPKYKNAGSAS